MTKPVRHAARILILTPERRFLLLHFIYTDGPLAGSDYWGVPGGGVEEGEKTDAAAVRELYEETGLRIASAGPAVAESIYDFRLSDGREVLARDTYYRLEVPGELTPSRANLTPEERINLAGHRWWSIQELDSTGEHIVPGDLASILRESGAEDRR